MARFTQTDCKHNTVQKLYSMCGWGLGKGGFVYECKKCCESFKTIPKTSKKVIDKFKEAEE